jgi:hypothetical protein
MKSTLLKLQIVECLHRPGNTLNGITLVTLLKLWAHEKQTEKRASMEAQWARKAHNKLYVNTTQFLTKAATNVLH